MELTEATLLDVYIGYDVAERVAYHVLAQSIIDHCSTPVRITPVALSLLRKLHNRVRVPEQSTDFSFSRFLVPYLSGYRGWSLFMDCDMLVRADLANLFALRDETAAVMVAKHNYVPRDQVKFLGNTQLPYPKKNWSSVILFNNVRCQALTPAYVEAASGLELHQFRWLQDDGLIGDLPLEWNWLVGEYASNQEACIAHFTRGGPYFREYADCDFADEWREVRDRTVGTAQPHAD